MAMRGKNDPTAALKLRKKGASAMVKS